jgi:hypothetical protein
LEQQKYEDGIALGQNYAEDGEDAQNNISQRNLNINAHLGEPNDDTAHMRGYAGDPHGDVNKINIRKKKKKEPEARHLEIKNAIFSNKAIRKLHSKKDRRFGLPTL